MNYLPFVHSQIDNFEHNGIDHEDQQTGQKTVKVAVIFGTNTITNPRTVMIEDADATSANLAMSRSSRFHNLD